MSRAELQVVLAQLEAAIDDLRDTHFEAPQHVRMASAERIAAIQDAARELRRLHKV